MSNSLETECCVVLVTASSEDEAKVLAKALLTERLAACVNLLPVASLYWWEGAIQQDQEFQLIIKTTLVKFELLEAKIQDLHTYDVPEIIALPIVQGSSSYLNWMTQSVR